MADITKNSYKESNQHQKVLFQRAKDVLDFELNELQDIVRVQTYRALKEGVTSSLNPGSNDDGYRAEGGVGNNMVRLHMGTLFCNGIPIVKSSDTIFNGFTTYTGGGTRTDLLYLSVQEEETTDPAAVPELGETSRRIHLKVDIGVAEGTSLPADSAEEIWEGGVKYFLIATVTRHSTVAAINADDVVDNRFRLPPYVIGQITHQFALPDGVRTLGNWSMTVGDGVNSFGDVNTTGGVNGIQLALNVLSDLGVSGASLFVKNGDYGVNTVDDQVQPQFSVTIIGESKEGVRIVNNYAAGDASIINPTNANLTLKNLTLVNGTGSVYGVKNSGGLVLDGVQLTGQRVLLTGFNLASYFRMKNTTIDLSSNAVTGSPVYIDDPGQVYTAALPNELPEYRIEDSIVRCATVDTHPAIGVVAYELSSTRVLGILRVLRSTFMLAGTNSAVSGANNPGIFGMAVASTVTGNLNKFTIGEFDSCKVYANSQRAGSNAALLYQPRSPFIRLILRGGQWYSPKKTSGQIPFYVTPGLKYPTAEDIVGAGSATTIEVTRFHCGWVDMNGATDTFANVGAIADTSLVTSQPSFVDAFVLCAERVFVDGLRIVGGLIASGAGDLCVVGKVMQLYDVEVEALNSGGSGSAPNHRVVFSYGSSPALGSTLVLNGLRDVQSSSVTIVSGTNYVVDASALDVSNGHANISGVDIDNISTNQGLNKGSALNVNVKLHHSKIKGVEYVEDGTAGLHRQNSFTAGPIEVNVTDSLIAALVTRTTAADDANSANIWKAVGGHQIAGGHGQYVNIYAGREPASGGAGEYAILVNIEWNTTAQTWNLIDTTKAGEALIFSTVNGLTHFSVPSGASPWSTWPTSLGKFFAAQVIANLFSYLNPPTRETAIPLLDVKGKYILDDINPNNFVQFDTTLSNAEYNYGLRWPIRPVAGAIGALKVCTNNNSSTAGGDAFWINKRSNAFSGGITNTIVPLAAGTTNLSGNKAHSAPGPGGDQTIIIVPSIGATDGDEYELVWQYTFYGDSVALSGNKMIAIHRQWSDIGPMNNG